MFVLPLENLRRHNAIVVITAILFSCLPAYAQQEDASTVLAAILDGQVPANPSELLVMQHHVQALSARLVAMTVAVQVGHAHGSGVIISQDGYVLTAAHVAGQPDQRAAVILHDGRRLTGKTLGVFRTLDAGLIRIVNPSRLRLTHAVMGDSSDVAGGQWCLATGHPGGYQSGRQPVVRLGRILDIKDDSTLQTDCTLISGDSGGPLFDLQGRVVGVHSRIGGALNVNLHVPISAYRQQWDRLARGEVWGHSPGTKPFIGVEGKVASDQAQITKVHPGTPADIAGIRPGDVIIRFGGKVVTDFDSLKTHVADEQPGNRVTVEVLREGEQRRVLQLKVGDRND